MLRHAAYHCQERVFPAAVDTIQAMGTLSFSNLALYYIAGGDVRPFDRIDKPSQERVLLEPANGFPDNRMWCFLQ